MNNPDAVYHICPGVMAKVKNARVEISGAGYEGASFRVDMWGDALHQLRRAIDYAQQNAPNVVMATPIEE